MGRQKKKGNRKGEREGEITMNDAVDSVSWLWQFIAHSTHSGRVFNCLTNGHNKNLSQTIPLNRTKHSIFFFFTFFSDLYCVWDFFLSLSLFLCCVFLYSFLRNELSTNYCKFQSSRSSFFFWIKQHRIQKAEESLLWTNQLIQEYWKKSNKERKRIKWRVWGIHLITILLRNTTILLRLCNDSTMILCYSGISSKE